MPDEPTRKVLRLPPDSRGSSRMIHELDCPWVNGSGQDPEWRAKFETIPASEVVGVKHGSCCAVGDPPSRRTRG